MTVVVNASLVSTIAPKKMPAKVAMLHVPHVAMQAIVTRANLATHFHPLLAYVSARKVHFWTPQLEVFVKLVKARVQLARKRIDA